MHFSVAVFTKPNGKTAQELLEPFAMEFSEEYLQFSEIEEDEIEYYKEILEAEKNKGSDVTLEDIILEDGFEKNEEGKIGRYYNQNSQWDWYEIGGRFSNILIKKDGSRCNEAKIKDIDWNEIAKIKENQYRNMWHKQNEYHIKKNGIPLEESIDEYVEKMKNTFTYAAIIPNGNWINLDDDINFYEKYIKNTNEETILTIVDCHI